MSLLGNITKVYAAKRLYEYISKDITQLTAYKLGVVDATGKQIIKGRDMTPAQKDSFGAFERVSFAIRRLLKNHGVLSIGLALTYLEEERFDEFMLQVRESYDDYALTAYPSGKYGTATANTGSMLSVNTVPPWSPSPFYTANDFNANVELLEDILLKRNEADEYEEDAPTTSTGGVASYPTPLGKKKDEKYRERTKRAREAVKDYEA